VKQAMTQDHVRQAKSIYTWALCGHTWKIVTDISQDAKDRKWYIDVYAVRDNETILSHEAEQRPTRMPVESAEHQKRRMLLAAGIEIGRDIERLMSDRAHEIRSVS
jgi:hypothetical protein